MTCEKIHFFCEDILEATGCLPPLLRRVVLPFHGKRSSHMFSGSTVDEDVTISNCMTESTENWILLGSARWLRSVVVALTGVITCWYFWKRCWMSVMFTRSSDAADCSELSGRTQRWAWNHRAAAQPPRDYWEIMFFVRHLTSNTTSASVPIGERKVSAYYSVMVVYLCVGSQHPLVNGRRHF